MERVLTYVVTEMDPSVDVEVVEATPKVRKTSKDSSGEDDEGFRCKDCRQGRSQPCFACHEFVQKKTGESKLYRCITCMTDIFYAFVRLTYSFGIN